MLKTGYWLVVALCTLPIVLGIMIVFFISLNYAPMLDLHQISLVNYLDILRWPGIAQSVSLTLTTGIISGLLALLASFVILKTLWQSRYWSKIETITAHLVAIPHVSFAIGFAFLLSPTGFWARLVEPLRSFAWFESFSQWMISVFSLSPHLPLFIKDPQGLGLTLFLIIKEIPFLLLLSFGVLKQINLAQTLKVGQSLGYAVDQVWLKCVFPIWFKKMRFAFYTVLAYNASVIDVAMLIAPTNPPTFALTVWQWLTEADLNVLPKASAGAFLLFLIVLSLFALMYALEHLLFVCCQSLFIKGKKKRLPSCRILWLSLLGCYALALPILLIWSLAKRWRFPDLLPSRWSPQFWQQEWHNFFPLAEQSLLIALLSASIACVFAIIALEYRQTHRYALPTVIICLPILLPQLSVLFGVQITLLTIDLNHYLTWVVWGHVFFSFPYCYLSMQGAWKSFDPHFSYTAASLGKSPWHTWWTIKRPMLAKVIIMAWLIGIGVSFSLYLPTIMFGAGRISTITTEAVAIASGHNRQTTAVYALVHTILALIFYQLSLFIIYLSKRLKRSTPKIKRVFDVRYSS